MVTSVEQATADAVSMDGRRPVLAFGVIPAYRRFELRQARYQDMIAPALTLAQQNTELNVLDIGSGLGCAKRFLDSANIDGRWTGIDLDRDRATLCRSLGYETVIEDHDLESDPLPWESNEFDLVIASHIWEHMSDAQGTLNEWLRVLKPGGLLILGVPMHLGAVAALARLRFRLFGRRPHGHCQFFSLRSLRRQLAGFKVEQIRGFRIISGRKWLALEDYRWFYRLSTELGRRWPGLTAEVNVEIRK